MLTLIGIIALHLVIIISGRKMKKKGVLEYVWILVVTFLIVVWVALNLYFMEKPEPEMDF